MAYPDGNLIPFCAACGRSGLTLFEFSLLSEGARKHRIKLKNATSTHWHPKCSRRVYAQLSEPRRLYVVKGEK